MLSSVEYSVTAACGNPHPDSRQAISQTCLSLAHLPETLGRGVLGKELGDLYRVTTLPEASAVGIIGLGAKRGTREARCCKGVFI